MPKVTVFAKRARHERAALWRVPEFHDLELLQVRHTTHAFPRHSHETYVIELVESGCDEFERDGSTHVAAADSLVLINPRQVHTGRPAGDGPLVYRSMYPSTVLMAEIKASLGTRDSGAPWFSDPVIRDPSVVSMFRLAHRALTGESDPESAGSLTFSALAHLIGRHGQTSIDPKRSSVQNAAVGRVCEVLLDELAENVSLDRLAAVAGLSRFHLLRVFRSEIGMPPHEFQINARVGLARTLIRSGRPICEVAAQTGFSDQSHLHRHFKRILGLTPGQIASTRAISFKTA